MIPLTIAIVTRRRPQLLEQCLISVLAQKPHCPIMVVENDNHTAFTPTLKRLAKRLSITHLLEPQPGTAHARNKALDACQTPWLLFVDDDCQIQTGWFAAANQVLAHQNPTTSRVGFVLGKTILANPHSLVARAFFHDYLRWQQDKLSGSSHLSSELLDTKNCILNTSAIHRHHVQFDGQFQFHGINSHEDVDLGMQLASHGLCGRYLPTMIVSHHETTNFRIFVSKMYRRGHLQYRFDHKWHLSSRYPQDTFNLHYLFTISPHFRYLREKIDWLFRQWVSHTKSMKISDKITIGLEMIVAEIGNSAFTQGYFDEQRVDKLTAIVREQNPSNG